MTPRSFSKRYLSIVRWILWQLVLVPRSDVFSQSRLIGIVYSVDVTKVAPIVRDVAVPVISFRSGFGHSSPKSGFPQIGSAEIGNRHLGTMQTEEPKRHGVVGRTCARRTRDLARRASSDDQSGMLA